MTIQLPVFRRTPGGVEMIGEWPLEMPITREMLEQADPKYLARRFRTITFRPGHDVAVYRIVGRDHPRIFLLKRAVTDPYSK